MEWATKLPATFRQRVPVNLACSISHSHRLSCLLARRLGQGVFSFSLPLPSSHASHAPSLQHRSFVYRAELQNKSCFKSIHSTHTHTHRHTHTHTQTSTCWQRQQGHVPNESSEGAHKGHGQVQGVYTRDRVLLVEIWPGNYIPGAATFPYRLP